MKKVLCFGTFDILHEGHKEFLMDAKTKGDFLFALVLPDKLVFKNKKRFPKNSQEKRAIQLKRLGIADKVIIVSDKDEKNFGLIQKIHPNLVVLGYDQHSNFLQRLKEILPGTTFIKSREFAGGIHSSNLRD